MNARPLAEVIRLYLEAPDAEERNQAWCELARRLEPYIRCDCARYSVPGMTPDDLASGCWDRMTLGTQDSGRTWLRAALDKHFPPPQPEPYSGECDRKVFSYLRRCIRNYCNTRWTEARSGPLSTCQLELEAVEDSTANEAFEGFDREEVRRAVGVLQSNHRVAIVLRYGLDYELLTPGDWDLLATQNSEAEVQEVRTRNHPPPPEPFEVKEIGLLLYPKKPAGENNASALLGRARDQLRRSLYRRMLGT